MHIGIIPTRDKRYYQFDRVARGDGNDIRVKADNKKGCELGWARATAQLKPFHPHRIWYQPLRLSPWTWQTTGDGEREGRDCKGACASTNILTFTPEQPLGVPKCVWIIWRLIWEHNLWITLWWHGPALAQLLSVVNSTVVVVLSTYEKQWHAFKGDRSISQFTMQITWTWSELEANKNECVLYSGLYYASLPEDTQPIKTLLVSPDLQSPCWWFNWRVL